MKKSSKRGMSTFGLICIVVGVLVLGWLVHLVVYPAEQATKIVEKTLDADNVIYNYEYFKQAYQDIKAMDLKIATAQSAVEEFNKSAGPREKWDFRDKEESSRLNSNLVGAKNIRNDMVATYNARSKMVNRSIFMGRDVPAEIEQ